jgi:MFS transporter, VNT family, synaptic vesicle glycoprotein 2
VCVCINKIEEARNPPRTIDDQQPLPGWTCLPACLRFRGAVWRLVRHRTTHGCLLVCFSMVHADGAQDDGDDIVTAVMTTPNDATASSASSLYSRRQSQHQQSPPIAQQQQSASAAGLQSAPRSLDAFLTECTTTASGAESAAATATPFSYWIIFLSLGVANSSDAAEILCISYVLSEEHFVRTMLHSNYDNDGSSSGAGWRAGLLAATVFGGMLLGGLLVGCLGDWYGRKPMLLTGLAINCASGLCSAGAANVCVLSAFRFAAGLGIGATVPPLFALCSELAPPRDRGFWVTVAASFWMVGSLFVAMVGWSLLPHGGLLSWRVFVALCAVPSALGCYMVREYVPESPRFLLLQRGQRHNDALLVVERLAHAMHYAGPQWSMEELLHYYPTSNTEPDEDGDDGIITMRTLPISGGGGGGLSMIGILFWTSMRDFTVSASQLYTPQLRSTTLPLQMVWFSLSFGSYGLLTWINTLFVQVHLENVYLNALLFSASNLPGNLLSAYWMDKTGRATMLTGSVLAAALSLVAFAYVAASRDDIGDESTTTTLPASWIVLAACSFQCFTIAAWNAIDVLTSELFPTSVRSTGMGVCAATGRIGAMMAQFVNGMLVSRPVRLLLVAATALLLGSITPALLPADQTGQPVQDYSGNIAPHDSERGPMIIAGLVNSDEQEISLLSSSSSLEYRLRTPQQYERINDS